MYEFLKPHINCQMAWLGIISWSFDSSYEECCFIILIWYGERSFIFIFTSWIKYQSTWKSMIYFYDYWHDVSHFTYRYLWNFYCICIYGFHITCTKGSDWLFLKLKLMFLSWLACPSVIFPRPPLPISHWYQF